MSIGWALGLFFAVGVLCWAKGFHDGERYERSGRLKAGISDDEGQE